jgi:hypothetical protein
MTAAEKQDSPPADPPTLAEALRLLAEGLWPVIITGPNYAGQSPGKRPIPLPGGWGKFRHSPDSLRAKFARYKDANLGIIDIDVDDPEFGEETLARIFPDGVPPTRGFNSARGPHYLFRWSDRLRPYCADSGKIEGKVKDDGEVEGNAAYAGLEIRLGFNASEEGGGQYQSVVPPSIGDDGLPRAWNGIDEIAELPESFFADLDRHAPPRPPARKKGPNILQFFRDPAPVPADLATRVRAYLATVEPAVSGSKGHNKTIGVACRVGPGYDLEPEVALAFLREWNQSCDPPWSEKELLHKVQDAYKREKGRGWLLNEPSRHHADNKIHFNPRNPPAEGVEAGVSDIKGDFVIGSRVPVAWGMPRLRESFEAPPFPLEVLPAGLADLCRQGAAALQCPVDYFGAAAVGLAGAAIGMSVNLAVRNTWVEAPNLYVAVVGPPGSGKTPAIKILSRPLYAIDRTLREQHKAAKAQYQQRKDQHEADRRKGGGGEPPEPPVAVHLTKDDVTREKIARDHAQNLRGLVLIQDELTAWVASLDAYRGGKGGDKQFWLRANSGAAIKVDRVSSDESIVIPRPCISVVGGMTPGTLPDIKDDRRDNGWLDRILFSYPESPDRGGGWSEAEVSDDLLGDWADAIDRLWGRQMVREEGRERPFFVRMTPRAREKWVEWFNAHRAEMGRPDFRRRILTGPWSKIEGFALRMALILSQLHQAYSPTSLDELPRDVDALDVWGATRLADYFKAHFIRAKGDLSGRHSDATDEAEAILLWIRRKELVEFSERDVNMQFHRFDHWSRLDALRWLVDRECIRKLPPQPRPPGQPGRPHSDAYEVNPHLLEAITKSDLIRETPSGAAPVADPAPPKAVNWLAGHLADGPAPAGLAISAGEHAGFDMEEILAAARAVGVVVEKRPGEGTFWSMPAGDARE